MSASLESLMRRSEEAIQDELVTVRNDRFVIPVRSDHRARVQGVAHGFSSSGATIFVEPLETIELNNDLVRLNDEELREIHRILREMTLRLREERLEIAAASIALADLDFIFGKAHFARAFDCIVPVLTEDTLRLKNARHPLLIDVMRKQRKAVTPLNLTLDADAPLVLPGRTSGIQINRGGAGVGRARHSWIDGRVEIRKHGLRNGR